MFGHLMFSLIVFNKIHFKFLIWMHKLQIQFREIHTKVLN